MLYEVITTSKNINIILQEPTVSVKSIINKHSENAGITIIGIHSEMVKHDKENVFSGYENIGTTLFIHSKEHKEIE